jgi:hypothetical protein
MTAICAKLPPPKGSSRRKADLVVAGRREPLFRTSSCRERRSCCRDRDHSLPETRTACQKSTPRNTTIKMRRIRPHPLESRALSSWGVSRSESLTSKPIGRPPASSVSRQNAKDFVKSLSGPKGDEGPEAQREGLPDCEDLRAILALQRRRTQQLWRGRQDPNPTLRVVAEPLTAACDALKSWSAPTAPMDWALYACWERRTSLRRRSLRLGIQARRNPLGKWKFERYRRRRRARISGLGIRSLISLSASLCQLTRARCR